jgi:hypothetical protein
MKGRNVTEGVNAYKMLYCTTEGSSLSPGGGQGFSLHIVYTGFRIHRIFYPMGNMGSFAEGKAAKA